MQFVIYSAVLHMNHSIYMYSGVVYSGVVYSGVVLTVHLYSEGGYISHINTNTGDYGRPTAAI